MKKLLLALGIGIAVFAAVFASAASLGLTTDDLGADDQVVASCDTNGVNVTYQTTYSATADTAGAYVVTSITLTGLDETNCANQAISATLSGDPSNAVLVTVTGTVGTSGIGTTEILPVSTVVLAEDVTGVHVVISGA